MQIDWFTVGAQIVNFLVLVYLLKRFLFKPIIESMERRERKIMERQKLAESQLDSAEQTMQLYLDKQKELEVERSEILNQAEQAAERQYTVLLGKLRDEIGKKRVQWQNELVKEQTSLMQEVGNVCGKKMITICRQVLRDLAGVQLEQYMVDRFLDELHQLSEKDKKKLLCSTVTGGNITVATGYELSQKLRDVVRDKLSELIPGVNLEFELRPEFVCGVALETSEELWSWNAGHYLDELIEVISNVTLVARNEEVQRPLSKC